ncbi:MAG: sigma 54-interacting transcriptional regulator [Planctomycetota bacterium]|nr:sigma 54-interacting transcriptional regulator [Planctomycetota bacterium]
MARKRSSANALKQLLSASSLPILVLDDQRRIVFANEACCRWVDVVEEDLVGQRCDYHSAPRSTPAEDAASGLCPPPEVFTGIRMTAEVSHRSATGTLERRIAEFIPLQWTGVELSGVLVIVEASLSWEGALQPTTAEPTPSELHQTLRNLRHELGQYFRVDHLVGESEKLHRVRAQVLLASDSKTHVVVVGNHGSGSETVARAIHYAGSTEEQVPVLPLASELFDGELLKSTITAFMSRERTKWEAMVPSILLLNADLLATDAQQELLDLLRLPQCKLRVITTTSRCLLALAAREAFSHDLALRLSSLVIELPPLASRMRDLPLLAQQFLEDANRQEGRQLSGISLEAMDCLAAYPWPGDVDELRELIQESAIVAEGPQITVADLPTAFHQAIQPATSGVNAFKPVEMDQFLAEVESRLIRETLEAAKGNKAQAARWLRMSRARLLRRIQYLGLE